MLEQLPKILEESRKQVERALNSPLKLRAQVSEIVYPNAKDGALFAQVVREDSALGRHSADFGDLEATADLKSSSAPKSPKSYESPTANLRILEEDNRGGFEKSASLSLRADKVGVAIHEENAPKTQSIASLEKVDSSGDSMDCHAENNARNDNNAAGGGGELLTL
ncbi:hypothetical protein [Helicobacter canis]|uniref:Glycosyltransferase n=1 Tax=Helicobacter canis TaxID=29419 RepID=A0A377J5I3_9HELI|nr:hypothetical protein [Helicobacter canis]STO97710.1 glycosyltransferase [Helicobacter canis]